VCTHLQGAHQRERNTTGKTRGSTTLLLSWQLVIKSRKEKKAAHQTVSIGEDGGCVHVLNRRIDHHRVYEKQGAGRVVRSGRDSCLVPGVRVADFSIVSSVDRSQTVKPKPKTKRAATPKQTRQHTHLSSTTASNPSTFVVRSPVVESIAKVLPPPSSSYLHIGGPHTCAR
jgi:hypothetical protein